MLPQTSANKFLNKIFKYVMAKKKFLVITHVASDPQRL